jgi:DNA primase
VNIQQAKRIPLQTLLAGQGHLPVKQRGDDCWYISPFRPDERTPSFKINVRKNLWYDFGEGQGGNLLDLAQRLFQTQDLKQTLQQLGNYEPIPPQTQEPVDVLPSYKSIDTRQLQHPALLDYLQTRAINPEIACQYLLEAHDPPYFYLAFRNDQGGFELRNKHFKGSTAPKATTTIIADPVNGRSNELLVFEGFMDFLSYLTLRNDPQSPRDALILNSLALLPKLQSTFDVYPRLRLFLDNDPAGKQALAHFEGRSYQNCAQAYYPDHKDLNEYLCQQPRNALQFDR